MCNLQDLFFDYVLAFAKIINVRDPYTWSHSKNVAAYSYMIGELLGLNEEEKFNLYLGALLHDIGKAGVPESILNKNGRLSADEWVVMKEHTTIGYSLLRDEVQFNERGITDVVLHHHERFDGKGYPHGLKGDQLLLAARIVAVADGFDAMTTNRSYRYARDKCEAARELLHNAGTQYDPVIAQVFADYILNSKPVIHAALSHSY
ncbi:HD-GYP domain-containing protein [Paenibacillus abyssi]|uniref:HD-GYP domain-containing protein n=2 Tax=Paenibacillus abyssi TaxID=1340531 RepID=A0A917LEX8_9BACL|nr:HD-GYP domain-containing protein [Paenibacillus abyssi]GGG17805.1 hypothetical protein GCM10010916_38270 [Paenibacillus abyssi]